MTGHSCSFSQTAETLPIYKPEVCHDGLKLWKCEWDLVHEGLDNTRIISFTCCWVYWFPHDPLTLQTSADKVKKHKVVNRGTLKRVKYDSLGFCGRMIHGSLVVLRSSEGTVITSHTYTHTCSVLDEVILHEPEDWGEQEIRDTPLLPGWGFQAGEGNSL